MARAHLDLLLRFMDVTRTWQTSSTSIFTSPVGWGRTTASSSTGLTLTTGSSEAWLLEASIVTDFVTSNRSWVLLAEKRSKVSLTGSGLSSLATKPNHWQSFWSLLVVLFSSSHIRIFFFEKSFLIALKNGTYTYLVAVSKELPLTIGVIKSFTEKRNFKY